MVAGIFAELEKPEPKNHFTIGIVDDVTHTSLPYDEEFSTEAEDGTRAVFFGLGGDGTVGANKNSVKIIDKGLEFYVVDGGRVAGEAGLAGRINTVLQTCFFALSRILPGDEAIEEIKKAIAKSYGKFGETVLQRNYAAVDGALAALHRVDVPAAVTAKTNGYQLVPDHAPDFVQRVTALMLGGKGDLLPVSALPVDGTFPTGTTRWEKRSIADQIPIWDPEICIDCAKCAMVCPHAAIRMKVYDP